MVYIVIHFFEEDLRIVLGDVEQFPFDIGKESFIENLPAVFGRQDEVVVAEPNAMLSPAISAFHTSHSITARERRMRLRASIPALTSGVFVRE